MNASFRCHIFYLLTGDKLGSIEAFTRVAQIVNNNRLTTRFNQLHTNEATNISDTARSICLYYNFLYNSVHLVPLCFHIRD